MKTMVLGFAGGCLAALAGAASAQGVAQAAAALPGATVATAQVQPAEQLPTPSFLARRLRMRMNLIDNGWARMTRPQFDEHYGVAQDILTKLKAQTMTRQQQQYALMSELRLRELDSQFETLHR